MRFFAGQSNRIPKKMGAFWIFKTDSNGGDPAGLKTTGLD
jgi:hypothetical protein